MIVNGPCALAEVASVPWKNGRGTTRTLACSPEGSGLDDFVWRISLAHIDSDAEFSPFPGVDRTILLWQGNGVRLQLAGAPDHALTNLYEPFQFSGEAHVQAALVDGPTVDLNLMVRRGLARGRLERCDGERELQEPCDDLVILCASGALQIVTNALTLLLRGGEYVHLHAVEERVRLVPEDTGAVYLLTTILAADGGSGFPQSKRESSGG